jgi:hypothetical protein
MLYIVYIILAMAVLSAALYFTINSNTKIIFQTPCGIQFLIDQPSLTTTIKSFQYTPRTGMFYTPISLVSEMNSESSALGFPLSVSYKDDRFYFSSPISLRILDREGITAIPPIVNGLFVAPRYGEAERFLNHLSIKFSISQPTLDEFNGQPSGETFTQLHSGRSLRNAVIGNESIPYPPTKSNIVLNPTNNALITVTWSPKSLLSGIYVSNLTAVPLEGLVSWDMLTNTSEYQLSEMIQNNQYKVGVSTIGFYDESDITVAPQTITIPVPTSMLTIDVLVGTGLASGRGVVFDTPSFDLYNNVKLKVVDCATARWPTNLLEVSQIKSVSIRFYASQYVASFPSDARVFFGPLATSPIIFYQYFRFLNRLPEDTSPRFSAPFYTRAFGSTQNDETNQSGEVPYATLTINDPGRLQKFFLNFGTNAGPPDVYMFYGYTDTRLQLNAGVPCVSLYQITYRA